MASRVRQSAAAISMPGVQMPHCAAPCARKARAQPAGEPVRPRALDGLDRAPSACAGRHEAGADLHAVEEHGAGAAVAGTAADLGAGEAELVAQRLRRAARRDRPRPSDRSPFTVSAMPRPSGAPHQAALLCGCPASARRGRAPAPARPPGGRRRRRGHRRWATGRRDGARDEAREPPRQRVARQSASSAASRRATAEQAPTAMRAEAMRPSAPTSSTPAAMAMEITR